MRVTESLGPQRVKIPDIVGQQERVAAIEVDRLGLRLDEISEMPYAGVPPGTVIAQNPQKGAEDVASPHQPASEHIAGMMTKHSSCQS